MEKLFKVTITETLVRNLGVKAKSLEEATKKVNGLYFRCKNKPYGWELRRRLWP